MAESEKIILNPLLNCVTRALTDGIKLECIVKACVAFYTHEDFIKAKRILHTELNITNRLVTYSKDEDNIIEICKILVSAAKNNVSMPKFVIFNPCSVPVIGDAVNATVTAKVNELSRKLDNFLATQSAPATSIFTSSRSAPETSKPRNSTYSVVLKNPPKELNGPNDRKAFIDSFCENTNDISELRKSANEWKLVVRSKAAAAKIVEKAKSSKPDLKITVREPLHIAVLRNVPEDINCEGLKNLIPNSTKTEQCGKSRSFKVYFDTISELQQFLSVSVIIGYERLPADPFKFLPRRCYNCHKIGHLASQCTAEPLCSRCASNEHRSTRDEPCRQPTFCVECKIGSHTCYSVKCPSNSNPQKK